MIEVVAQHNLYHRPPLCVRAWLRGGLEELPVASKV
jgi:hypothetical protein